MNRDDEPDAVGLSYRGRAGHELSSRLRGMRCTWSQASVLVMLLVLLASLFIRTQLIENALPYCRHPDEQHWSTRAINIVRTGDWNPKRFTKPSSQVYLMTGGLVLGLVRAGAHGAPHTPESLGKRGGYPYYANAEAVKVAKELFALSSVLALGIAAALFHRLWRRPVVLFLGPLFAMVSELYLSRSWKHMNVDILGCFFAMATLGYLFLGRRDKNPACKMAVAGVLCGLTLGTKYNLFFILVPCCLYAFFHYRDRWVSHCVLLLTVTLITFFVVTPYAILDVPLFTQQMAYEANHYGAAGHQGHPNPTGLPALAGYLQRVVQEFGLGLLVASVGGVVALARKDWRQTLILASFPALLTAYMSTQKYFTPHNVLILFCLLPFFAAVGAGEIYAISVRCFSRRAGLASRARLFSVISMGVMILGTLPWGKMAHAYDFSIESRNEIKAWINAHVPRGETLLLEERLSMDVAGLGSYKLVEYDSKQASFSKLARQHPGALILVPEVDEWTGDVQIASAKLDPVATFGSTQIRSGKSGGHSEYIAVPSGDPIIKVIRLP